MLHGVSYYYYLGSASVALGVIGQTNRIKEKAVYGFYDGK
jgi:hypothetical protein